MNILVLCDDFYHHGDVVKAGLETLATDKNKITFASTGDDFSGFDMVFLCKDDMQSSQDQTPFMDEVFFDNLEAFVKNGGTLVALHAGTVSPKKHERLLKLIGCAFDQHPEQLVVSYEPTDTHELTNGVKAFAQMDEHYFLNVVAEDITVFMHSVSEHGKQIAGYVRKEGDGLVFMLTPGHNLEVFTDPQFHKLLQNVITFAGEK